MSSSPSVCDNPDPTRLLEAISLGLTAFKAACDNFIGKRLSESRRASWRSIEQNESEVFTTVVKSLRREAEELGSELVGAFESAQQGDIVPNLVQIARLLEHYLAKARTRTEISSYTSPLLDAPQERFDDILRSFETCKGLKDALQAARGGLELGPEIAHDEEVEESSTVSLKASSIATDSYDALFHAVATGLFDAISKEGQQHGQELRLRLGELPSRPSDEDDWSLDILFKKQSQKGTQHWLPVRIHSTPTNVAKQSCETKSKVTMLRKRIHKERAEKSSSKTKDEEAALPTRNNTKRLSRVPSMLLKLDTSFRTKFDDGSGDQKPWRKKNPIRHDRIRQFIEERAPAFSKYLHHIEHDGSPGWLLHDMKLETEPGREYNLGELSSIVRWGDVAKMAISLNLAQALVYYYGSGWLTGHWELANISVFQKGTRIALQPWLKVLTTDTPLDKFEASPEFKHPKLIELGIFFIELELGETIERFLKTVPSSNIAERWAHANDIWEREWLSGRARITSMPYRRVIEFCLRREHDEDPDNLRKAIYDHVVIPLREIVSKSDTPMDKLDLGDAPSRNEGITFNQTETLGCKPAPAVPDVVELFSNDLQADESVKPSVSDLWINDLRKLIHDKLKDDTLKTPIKVALLDTGIDMKHSHFTDLYPHSRIKSIRSWVDGGGGLEAPDGGDENGHGTFIASLLLDICPNIELYVARVSKKTQIPRGNAVIVADALRCAIDEWKVDIINMSFGFPDPSRDIHDQIRRVTRNEPPEKSILVFAAAANDRKQARTYPATNSSVFAIHSFTGMAKASAFNPSPEPDHNFGTLGENIESAWLTGNGGSGRLERRSGTSFATPIVVCQAAFLLAYIPVILPDHQKLFYKVQTYDGMAKLLQATVIKDDVDPTSRYQYVSLAQLFDRRKREPETVADMFRKALSY